MKHTFEVTMTEEHPDGSATFTLNGTREAIQTMMESMLRQAIIDGIGNADARTEEFIYQHNLQKEAKYLVNCVDKFLAFGTRPMRLELEMARDRVHTLLLQCSNVNGKL